MTRPRPASEAFIDGLPGSVRAMINPIFSPLIEIVALGAAVDIAPQDGVIFTSANGVRAAPAGEGRHAYCVGAATTAAAKQHGWNAHQSGIDADTLVARLATDKPTQHLFHLSGRHTRGDVAGRLNKVGLTVRNVALYDQCLCDLTETAAQAIMREKRVVVPLFSPRTAAQFVSVAPRTSSCYVIALSPAVAEALGTAHVAELILAPHPDAQAMGAALAKVVANA